MIRFQDTVEKKDTSELLSSATFQDIRPTGSMSTEDAVLFLDGLFSIDPESQDMYSIDEESLLAEIFGRFEDEFDFDFELDDEIQTVLDRFGAAKWENLSDGSSSYHGSDGTWGYKNSDGSGSYHSGSGESSYFDADADDDSDNDYYSSDSSGSDFRRFSRCFSMVCLR